MGLRVFIAAFQTGETFPGFVRGAAMLERFGDANIPIGGFIRASREEGWAVVGSCWDSTPSAHVTRDAFERISDVVLADLRESIASGGVDAVYLDLHGAAVAGHGDDAEGELLSRIRSLVGAEGPLVESQARRTGITEVLP